MRHGFSVSSMFALSGLTPVNLIDSLRYNGSLLMSSPYQPRNQMTRLHEKLSAILTICQQMNSVRDLGALLDLVAREATRLLDADRASIFLLDRERMELWSKV